jgi:cytochrome c oxidase subunit II
MMKNVLTAIVWLLCAGSPVWADGQGKIDIVASRFSYRPAEITLKRGQPVTLVFHSTDVTHGLKIPELGIDTAIRKGQDSEITVTPSQTGQFTGKCAYFCGKGHGSMTLVINVVD